MGNTFATIFIDPQNNYVVTGVIEFDRSQGGTLVIPAGTALPASDLVAGEFFYNTTTNQLFRRNDANSGWDSIQSTPAPHASTHIDGGSDVIDGDKIEITFVPTNYAPDDSIAEADATDQLAAHLKGIDDVMGDVFGSNRVKGEDLPPSITTTAGAWVEKLTIPLTVTADNEGDYILQWSYFWSHDSASNDFEARIQQNNATTIMFHKQEPKDSGGSGPGGTDQRHPASGFIFLNGLTAGPYSFDLDFRTLNPGVESTILDARMILYRES
jgi:hypothetical protein